VRFFRFLIFVWFVVGAALARADGLLPVVPSDLGQAIQGTFDGRVFAVDFGQDGKKPAGKDVIRFENGKMSTALCSKFGFEPAPYLVRVEGDKIHFYAEMVSATQGKNIFSGYVEKDKLTAHANWAQPRWYWTIHVASWFEGAQADPKADLPAFLE
jgi:hypothetical protein